MILKKNPRNWKVKKGEVLTDLDKRVLGFQNRGCLVPSKKLIKTPEQIEGIRRSGIVNTGVLDYVAEHIKVRIVQSSACASCEAKAICSSSESKEKIVDIYVKSSENYAIGEQVNVCASETMGRNAVILAFVIPLVIMMSCITISIKCLMINELMSIAISLIYLALYYCLLSISKKRISKKFSFWIEKP